MSETRLFAPEINKLDEVKQGILKAVQNRPSPTIGNYARLTIDNLDQTFMCLGHLEQIIGMFDADAADKLAEQALARGNLKVVPEVK